MFVLITGVPGTGKSFLANEIKSKFNRYNFQVINDKEFSIEKAIGTQNEVDNVYDVDISKLSKEVKLMLQNNLNKNIVFEGHLFAEISKFTLSKFNYIFVLDCSERLLRKRLIDRNYDVIKIEDNVFCKNLNYIQRELESKKIPFNLIKVTDDSKLNINKLNKFIKL